MSKDNGSDIVFLLVNVVVLRSVLFVRQFVYNITKWVGTGSFNAENMENLHWK